jgi:hypothetical protein
MDQNTSVIVTRARLAVRRQRPAHRRSTRSRWLEAVRGLLPAGSSVS